MKRSAFHFMIEVGFNNCSPVQYTRNRHFSQGLNRKKKGRIGNKAIHWMTNIILWFILHRIRFFLFSNRSLKVNKLLQNETYTGRIEYVYDIYEKKQEGEKQGVENLGVEFLGVENQGQYNINNKILKNKNIKYNIYGEYKRIKLTDDEYNRLVNDYGEEFIKKQIKLLDEYVESNNNKNKYTNFNLVLRKSIRDNWFKNKAEKDVPDWFYEDLDKEDTTDEEFDKLLKEIGE